MRAVGEKLRACARGLLRLLGFGRARPRDFGTREEYNRYCTRRSYKASTALHLMVILASLVAVRGCLHKVPKGIPMGKGNTLPAGKVVIKVEKRIRRRRLVRQSPVSIYQMLQEEEEEMQQRANQAFSDSVGVPGGVGEGAAAAGSPHGTVLGGRLYFYRIKFDGPTWDANSAGVRPLMEEVLRAGVVKKVSGFNNVVTLKDLPRHSDEYMPSLLYMTGTGQISASNAEVENLRDYLTKGGMLFADVSGGSFHEHFVRFMKRVFPEETLTPIEFDHEIYRGANMPYAMAHGCPIYRQHQGCGPALGIWVGPRLSVFYSRGDLGAGWGAAGIFSARRREVEQAFRMGVNIVAYSLLYYKYTGP